MSTRSKDKAPVRPSPNLGSKSTFRRLPTGPGSKVSNIAKHFERLGRDAERSKSRYSVIRGKRARPVASARAKVEILDSVKDAIKDESESSDSSSEADDEDEGIEEERTVPELVQQQLSAESDPTSPNESIKTAPPVTSFSDALSDPATQEILPPGPVSLPPSPFLSSVKNNDVSLTPPTSDVEMGPSGTERNSILKALSGFWLQQPPSRTLLEDDPMSDPEHIFRDSSMVVRTDEPTSIIALALKCVTRVLITVNLLIRLTVHLNTVICLRNLVLRNARLVKQSSTIAGKLSCLMIVPLPSQVQHGESST
jgi:1-phosphatidylinositol-3-phosphate 5-kinase